MSDASGSRRSIAPWILGAGAALAVAGLVAWVFAGRTVDHWDEVARARAYLDRGRPDLAFRAVSKIRDEAPGSAEALTLAARILLMRGDVSTARRALERSLKIEPEQADAAKMLAAIYLAWGDGPRGLALLQSAARLDPRDFRPWYAMGKVHHDLGDLAKSADAYAEALRRSPPPAEANECRIGRIRALLDGDRDDEAAASLAEARRLTPDDPQVLALAARQAQHLGRSAEARDLADRALAVDAETFDALLVRARLHNLAGRTEAALADLERAVRVNPNDPGALQLLAQVQSSLHLTDQLAQTKERLRRTQERIALMDQLTKEINRRPQDPEPRWRMGQAAAEGGIDTLAFQCFQAALDIDPNYKPARDALAKLRAEGRLPSGVSARPALALPGGTSRR
jgi:tetratricopeptide (TPR) repeat protein